MLDLIETWMTWLSSGIFLMGVGMILLGDHFGFQKILGGGFAAIGLASALSGLESVITRKASFVPWSLSGRKATSYQGLPAVLWGMLFLAFGGLLGLAGTAIVFVPGGWDAVVQAFFQTPFAWGVLILGLGLLAFILGLIRALSGTSFADPTYNTTLMEVGERLGGVILMGIGVVLAASGVLVGLAPDVARSILARAASILLTGSP